MTHEEALCRHVEAVRRRVRLLLAQQGLCVGMTVAAGIGLALVAATRLQWWTDAVDYIGPVLFLGAALGALLGWFRPVSRLTAARIAEERADLKERLSTALVLSERGVESEVARAQRADAARCAAALRPADLLPWRLPSQARFLAIAIAALLAALYLPDLPIFSTPQQRLDREAMREQGRRLQAAAREIERRVPRKRDDPNAEILRRIARNMERLGRDQERGRITKKQAMLRLNDLRRQLQQARNARSVPPGSLDRVAEQLRSEAARQEHAGNRDRAQALEQMARHLAARDFQAAARQLEEQARSLTARPLTPEEARQAAETLERMASAMRSSALDPAARQLEEAASALRQAAQQASRLQQQARQASSAGERQRLDREARATLARGTREAGSRCQQAGGT